jgi:hypothetical protein
MDNFLGIFYFLMSGLFSFVLIAVHISMYFENKKHNKDMMRKYGEDSIVDKPPSSCPRCECPIMPGGTLVAEGLYLFQYPKKYHHTHRACNNCEWQANFLILSQGYSTQL